MNKKIFINYMRVMLCALLIVFCSVCTDSNGKNDKFNDKNKTEQEKNKKKLQKVINYLEEGKEVYHENTTIGIKSIAITDTEKKIWFPGKNIPKEMKENSNVEITAQILGMSFGPLDGYDNGKMTIGWNNQDKIIFIQVYSQQLITSDMIRIGTSKREVLSKLGIPYMEKKNLLQYANIENEMVGLLLIFTKDEIVTELILFTYI